jgi:acetoin utilization protein AcuB
MRAAVDHGGPVWLEPMPVRRWMQRAPATVGAEATVADAAVLMRTRRIRHLPVVAARDRLVGIVTDRDLRQVVFDPAIRDRLGEGALGLDQLPLREVMTWGVVSVRPGTDLRDAARVMHERKIGALPVTEGGALVGILTETDVLAALREILRHRLTGARPMTAPPGGPEPDDVLASVPTDLDDGVVD